VLHPLFLLLSNRTQLLVDHAEAYAALIAAEAAAASGNWKRCALLHAVALCTLATAAVLAGVALMLWATVPPENMHAPWALWVAPLVPAVVALGCVAQARASSRHANFSQLRQQLQADLALLHEVGHS